MYQAKSGVKNFSLYWGGGRPLTKIFFPVWTCIKPNLVSKIFPFTGGGGGGVGQGSPWHKFFFWSEHVSSQILCQKFFPLLGGRGRAALDKNFFLVWTCIKPNLVSKFFPFTGGGGGVALDKKFFSSLNMYQAKSGVKKFSLYWDRVPSPPAPWTDTHLWKHNLPSYVRTRAVIMDWHPVLVSAPSSLGNPGSTAE